ncbi:MAG TPA: hypothetical protein VF517_15550 [Thermoleophilaceae bacterium]|jgi:hypothetical protein
MSLWRRLWADDQARPEGLSDRQRLEQLLYRLADDIADDDHAISRLSWSREVRAAAGLVGAGNPRGLSDFVGLFDPDPRNTFNEQRFVNTRTFDEAGPARVQAVVRARRGGAPQT